MLQFSDFTKLDIRLGTIIAVEKILETDKLIKVLVDLGTEKKQLVAGIGKKYQTQDLLGKQIPVVCSIEPTKIRGVLSEGIFVAIDTGQEPVLLVPEEKTPNGSKIR